MKNLSVLVPFFNEEETLYNSVTKLISTKISDEIILINDNSIDKSLKIAEELVSKNDGVELITIDKNLGKGNAVALGLKKANSDFVIVHDADLEYNPFDIERLLEAIQKYKILIL